MDEEIKEGEKEMGDNITTQCSNHPNNKNPGGICAFCLQEKLGNLLSSSLSLPPIFKPDSTSSSSSPSFKSVHHSSTTKTSNLDNVNGYYKRRVPITFLLAKRKKKKLMACNNNNNMVLKRSKSAATPGRPLQFLDNEEDFSSRKRNGFWSFLYSSRKMEKSLKPSVSKEKSVVLEEDDESMNSSQVTGSSSSSSSSERKVSRSRSVGCGSRSFSGDFFGRISNGFGDCTLRRVESQREGKAKAKAKVNERASERHGMKERVRCGGIFGGLIMDSSSSSCQKPSSSYGEDGNGKLYGRTKSWAWAFASPMRPFSKPTISSSRDDKRVKNNATPDLAAIPSLLTVRG